MPEIRIGGGTRTAGLWAGALALLAGLALGGSAGAQTQEGARVTSLAGEATVGGKALDLREVVPSDEEFTTGPDTQCSVLVHSEAVAQFCGGAAVRFREADTRTAGVLGLERGRVRLNVAPQDPGRPLEIQTPVAVAAILGTVVVAEVEPSTGDTIFSVEEGSVRVTSRDPGAPGSVVLQAGEQVTVQRGKPPGRVRTLDTADFTSLTECLGNVRLATLRNERSNRAEKALASVVADDIPTDLPAVGASRTRPSSPPAQDTQPVLDGSDTAIITNPAEPEPPVVDPPPPMAEPPRPCMDAPGDHCSF